MPTVRILCLRVRVRVRMTIEMTLILNLTLSLNLTHPDYEGIRGDYEGTTRRLGGTARRLGGLRGDYEGTRGDYEWTRGDYEGTRGDYEGTRGDYEGTRGDYEGTRGLVGLGVGRLGGLLFQNSFLGQKHHKLGTRGTTFSKFIFRSKALYTRAAGPRRTRGGLLFQNSFLDQKHYTLALPGLEGLEGDYFSKIEFEFKNIIDSARAFPAGELKSVDIRRDRFESCAKQFVV